jgi:acetyl-CoA decarbonylase/synthase complex subunit gamma
MRLAAGKESLDKCPYASPEAHATLGAASAPPIRGVTLGQGPRAITVGEETVFFRHEKTFVRKPGFFRTLDVAGVDPADLAARLDAWRAVELERAGEVFQIDGVALVEAAGRQDLNERAAAAVAKCGLPAAVVAATPEGAAAMLEPLKDQRPLLVPPAGAPPGEYIALAARLKVPLVVSGSDLEALTAAANEATQAGVADVLLEAPARDLRTLHQHLSQIRRGALDRAHPGLAHPAFLRVGPGEIAKAIVGVTKFASIIVLPDDGGELWLPLWTLRQNIYTDPQKPLQIAPGIYPIGEPDSQSPLLVTTNFSLTYFIVSTELDGTGMAAHLAIVDAEGMSVLTAWSAGKFSGERVAKGLRELGALERVTHRTVIVPGYVAVISGELEDALGDDWRVLSGPQEASDLTPFFRDVWAAAQTS